MSTDTPLTPQTRLVVLRSQHVDCPEACNSTRIDYPEACVVERIHQVRGRSPHSAESSPVHHWQQDIRHAVSNLVPQVGRARVKVKLRDSVWFQRTVDTS